MAQSFIGVSLSHHRAPVEVREQMALSESEAQALLSRMKGTVVKEALLISTCNRTELYALPAAEHVTSEYLIDFLLSSKKVPANDLTQYKPLFERYTYCDAITHLFSVIAGIDSQIIGDQQIFSQVKDAFRVSTETETAGGFLTKLAHTAFRVAKRVITETTITTGASTISYAAVEFARKIYDDLRPRTALIIGAGETAELAAKHLSERQVGTLVVANRNIENAQAMLERVRQGTPRAGDRAVGLANVIDAASKADIIISSTAATEYILTREMMSQALRMRSSSYPQVLIDIAVPRDIDPEIAKLANVFLKDIDDLRSIIDQNLERRKQEIPKAEAIIREELDGFLASLSKLEVGPTIKELRDKFEEVRREELERHRAKMDDKTYGLIEEMTRRMMNRLLHAPTVSLKEPHGSTDDLLTRVELVRELFALGKLDDDQPEHTSEHS